MRVIFSRKGFDSGSGGCPSPIFPDGSIYSLPIPDKGSSIAYKDLEHSDQNIARLICELTGDIRREKHFAHLDPDLHYETLPRLEGWKPLLGQTGSAQGHLRNEGVETGDLLLFFGLFRQIETVDNVWRFVKNSPARHIIWGWMQIGNICKVDQMDETDLPWARYHPHFGRGLDGNNTLYIAADNLSLNGNLRALPGAGVFGKYDDQLLLTDPGSTLVTQWRLPRALYPAIGKPPLSYHSNMGRWQKDEQYSYLKSVSRGQEFVLQTDDYPGVYSWLESILSFE